MRKTCMAWGCACGNGWFHIMNAAFKVAEHPGAVLLQVKEKFGGLRLYWMGPGPPDFPALTDKETDRIRTALDTAEDRSYQVCEMCGDPGKVRRGGWVYTMCDRCHSFNSGSATYEIDANDRFTLGAIADATGDKIARSLNLRTTCATDKDHYTGQGFTHCLICKEQLRVKLPSVEQEEDKATVVDCPQINPKCNGKLTKNTKGHKWMCDTCGKQVGVLQIVVPPATIKGCFNCPDGVIRAPDWACDKCEWVGENE